MIGETDKACVLETTNVVRAIKQRRNVEAVPLFNAAMSIVQPK